MLRRLRVVALRLALAGVPLGLSTPSMAHAAAPPETGSPEAVDVAKGHFHRAKEAYREGAYRRAIVELRQALRLDPDGKDLVYNLALVYEKLGDIDQAITWFERYQEMETDAGERARTETTLRRLRGAKEEIQQRQATKAPEPTPQQTEAAPKPRPEPSAVPDRPGPGRLDAWVWATGGVALAAAAVGTVFAVRAVDTQPKDDDATGPTQSIGELEDRAERAHREAIIADVSFGVSAVSAVAALWLYFGRDAQVAGVTPSVHVARERLSVGGTVRF